MTVAWKIGVWDVEFVSPGPPRSRPQDGIQGFILLEEMPMREEIEWEPERLGEHHSIINASPTLSERATQGGLGRHI